MTQGDKSKSDNTIRLVMSCDLGGSCNKSIVHIYPSGTPKVMVMSPEVAEVGKIAIAQLREQQANFNSTWVGIGEEYYVLGSLAKNQFAGTAALRELKYHYALPKIAGLLWRAYRHYNIDRPVDLFVQLLLPPGELNDAQSLLKELSSALKQGINTPSGKLKAKLRRFDVSPEGVGILQYRSRNANVKYFEKVIGLLMLGYRNATYIVVDQGSLAKAETTDLGMNWAVQQFVERTAVGLSTDNSHLVTAMLSASQGDWDGLRRLSRKSNDVGLAADLKLFQQVLPEVRDAYCRALVQWIRKIAILDEILICGGTAEFVRTELTEHFQNEGIPIVWNGNVEFPKRLDTQGLNERAADVWTSFITYIKMLDKNFGYERKQNLVPE